MEAPERSSIHHHQRRKRTFSQMATIQNNDDDDFTPLDDLLISPVTLRDSSTSPPLFVEEQPRHQGISEDGSDSDGRRVRRAVDGRRPIFTTATRIDDTSNIIDLTSDTSENEEGPAANTTRTRRSSISGRQAQRLPRFAREIIDLDDDSEATAAGNRSDANRSPSPEIQIVGTRQLPTRTQARQPTPTLRRQDAQEVTFLETRRLPTPPPGFELRPPLAARRRLPTPHIAARRQHGPLGRIDLERHFGRLRQEGFAVAQGLQDIIRDTIGFDMGITLNYENPGFDLGPAARMPRAEPPARPAYEPPPKVGEGFTRSPEEDELLVCPKCGDELCEGEGTVKRQIWVVKKCGHVYCGQCYNNRAPASRKKSKDAASEKFTHCVVQDCGKPVGGKTAMFQVYL